jgi:hypothetical protein
MFDPTTLASEACDEAQAAVRARLKSPATAEFPSCGWSASEYVIRQNADNTAFTVEGHVDAQNSFGAKLRNKFTVMLTRPAPNAYVWNVVGVVIR